MDISIISKIQRIMSSNEIFLKIISFLIKGKQNEIEKHNRYYLFIEDAYSHFNSLDTPTAINILDKTFLIKKLNYFNEFDIDDPELVEEITDENYSIIFFRYAGHLIEKEFKGEHYNIFNFSVLNLIIQIFNFDLDKEVSEKIQLFDQKFLEETFFIEFCKSVEFFSKNSVELIFFIELNFENFFDILFVFFSNGLFIDTYYNKLRNKLENKKKPFLFEDSLSFYLIEMLFYIRLDEYNPELFMVCFEFLDTSNYNDDFKVIIEIVKIISGNRTLLQNFLQNIFFIDLFQLKCGRGSFKLNQSHLDSFNRKSNFKLTNVFEEINRFCVFTKSYVKLLSKPDFREYIKERFIKDFERKYEAECIDFKKKHIDSIENSSLFKIDNQTYFFSKSYSKWIRTFSEIIFYDIIDEIKHKYIHGDLDYSNIKRNITYYLQNLPRIEVFYNYIILDKKIIENLLKIIENSIDIILDVTKEKNNTLDFWRNSAIIEKIYNNDLLYREIREIYVQLDNKNPIFELLTNNIDKEFSFLKFNDYINEICLKHFFSLIKREYFKEIQAQESNLSYTKDIPLLVKEIIKKNSGIKIILIIVDGLRYDIWNNIWKDFILKFHLEVEKRIKLFSLLPSITEVSRESMYFDDIDTKFATPNQIKKKITAVIELEDVNYIPLSKNREIIGGDLQKEIDLNLDLNIIMTPYPDHRIHQIENNKELYNNNSFYTIVNDIRSHLEGIYKAIFNEIKNSKFKKSKYKIIITSDHGFIDYYKEIPYHTSKPDENSQDFLEMNRYLKCKEAFKNFINFKKEDLSKILEIPIGNQKNDFFLIPYGRNYFLRSNSSKKPVKNIGHGGISFYENIIPFYIFSFIDAKRQIYAPQIIFVKKDELLLSTTNQIKFVFSNQDQNYPIKILSYEIKSKDNLIRKTDNFERENENEGLLLNNRSSKEYYLLGMNNNEKFKLFYTIFYSFIDEEGKETPPISLKGEEEFTQQVVQNPEVKIERASKWGMIKERFYQFIIEIYNPNNFPLENIQLLFESSEEIQLEVSVFKKIDNFTLKKLESNQNIELNILLNFKENCKMDLKIRGFYDLPNLITRQFIEPRKLHLDIFESEAELNQPIFQL